MARIEVDPNYSSPSFSRATAGTDPFKMTDVQSLAAAVSTHDHTTGKGVQLSAGSIPAGSITSAMIADGAIQTADIAPSAVQQLLGAYVATPTFNTTTIGTWVATPVSVNVTTTGGTLRIEFSSGFQHSVVGGLYSVGLAVDGVVFVFWTTHGHAVANGNVLMSGVGYDASRGAGSHTYTVMAQNQTAGTLTQFLSGQHTLYVTEQKR